MGKLIQSLKHKPSRVSARAVKARRTPIYSYTPNNNVVLGIDPGDIPGWSIYIHGVYQDSGIAKQAIDKQCVVLRTYEISKLEEKPILFIAENWPSAYLPDRKRMSNASILGMGMNWGKWLQEIEKLHIPYKVHRINTLVWRKFYGIQKYSKDQAKRAALDIVRGMGIDGVKDHNEAEAILISKVGGYLEV